VSRGAQLRDAVLAPEDVLFRRAGAPMRYAEKDIYHAHEVLPHGGQGVLPDSDMLKAIHSYVAQFYAALAERNTGGRDTGKLRGTIDDRSMDETALLALGILLEEGSREMLGRRGDLVFTEGAPAGQDGRPLGDADSDIARFLDAVQPRRHRRSKGRHSP
jgi:hypothetical protein